MTVACGAVSRLTPQRNPSRVYAGRIRVEAGECQPHKTCLVWRSRRWNGRRGVLYLAPPYIHGGQLGDHLVFQWQQSGCTYVVSLHTWWPQSETAAMLRAIVASPP